MIKIANNLLNLLAKTASDTSRPLPPDGGFKQTWGEGGTPIISYGDTLPTSYVGEDALGWHSSMPDLTKPRYFDENGWKGYSKMMTPEEYASRRNRQIGLGEWSGMPPGGEDYMAVDYFRDLTPFQGLGHDYDGIRNIKAQNTWADYLRRTTPTTPTPPTGTKKMTPAPYAY